MKFGKVSFNPNHESFIGMTKTKFKKKFKGKEYLFRPHSIDEVWEKFRKAIPKK